MITSVNHPGATYAVHGWAMLGCAAPLREELVFICAMLHHRDAKGHRVLMQTCRFSFEQLRVKRDANRLSVPVQHFQAVINEAEKWCASAPPSATASVVNFNARGCGAKGPWLSSVLDLAEVISESIYFRPIHLASSTQSSTQLTFIFR